MKIQKIEGPRVRGSKSFIALLNNACFSLQKCPNAGTPEILRLGFRQLQAQDPERFRVAVLATAKELQITEAEVMDIVNG